MAELSRNYLNTFWASVKGSAWIGLGGGTAGPPESLVLAAGRPSVCGIEVDCCWYGCRNVIIEHYAGVAN